MTAATPDDLRKLEELYASRPAAYRRKVLGLISLGYLYVFSAILLTAGFVIGGSMLFATGTLTFLLLVKFIKFGLPAAAVAGVLSRSLFVSIPKPQGIYLEGPVKNRVLKYFEEVRREVGGLRVNDVVITDDLNAAVQQLPLFGIVGPARNYLILGAPLLQLMTPSEVKAVVAHEFGHLSHEHGRMGALVYRLDQTLVRATLATEGKSRSGFFGMSFGMFASFYERFSKVTFAMRRGQEYEADAAAARATSADAIASALCRLNALTDPLDSYWSEVWKRTVDLPENSAVSPFASMREGVANQVRPALFRVAIRRALNVETDYSDTHPALKDRLAALDELAVTDFATEQSAFEDIFSPAACEELLARLDSQWRLSTADVWKIVRDDFEQAMAEMNALREQRQTLDADGLQQLAGLEESIEGIDTARETYRLLLDRYPDSAHAHYHWGRLHIFTDFPVAESSLLRSAELDLETAGDVGALLEIGYEDAGRSADFDAFKPTLERFGDLCEAAGKERAEVTPRDEYVVPDLAEAIVVELRRQSSSCRALEKLYVVEKPVEYFRHHPLYVIGLYFNEYAETDEETATMGLRLSHDFCSAVPALGNPFWVITNKSSEWSDVLEDIDGAMLFDRRRDFVFEAPPPLSTPAGPATPRFFGKKFIKGLTVMLLTLVVTLVLFSLIF